MKENDIFTLHVMIHWDVGAESRHHYSFEGWGDVD